MNVDPIKRFLARNKAASQTKAAEVRMSLQEANELSMAIGELMADHVDVLQNKDIHVDVKMDGGGFK